MPTNDMTFHKVKETGCGIAHTDYKIANNTVGTHFSWVVAEDSAPNRWKQSAENYLNSSIYEIKVTDWTHYYE